jgi:hypothetical protein
LDKKKNKTFNNFFQKNIYFFILILIFYLFYIFFRENSKIPRFVKEPAECEELKEFLRSKYKMIKDTYKYYASKQPIGDVWAISTP